MLPNINRYYRSREDFCLNCKQHAQIFNSVEHWTGKESVEGSTSALHYFHNLPCSCRELIRFPCCLRNTRCSLVLCCLHEEADNFMAYEIVYLTPHQMSRLFRWNKEHQCEIFKSHNMLVFTERVWSSLFAVCVWTGLSVFKIVCSSTGLLGVLCESPY